MNHLPSISGPGRFAIRVHGRIDGHWAASFEGLEFDSPEPGVTVLSGQFADQAALHGALEALRALGVPLISVTPLD